MTDDEAVVVPGLLPSGPTCKAQARARSGRRAIAGEVVHPVEIEMFERTGGADPVADLGAAGLELRARHGLQRLRVLFAQRPDELAVERLVDGEVD